MNTKYRNITKKSLIYFLKRVFIISKQLGLMAYILNQQKQQYKQKEKKENTHVESCPYNKNIPKRR